MVSPGRADLCGLFGLGASASLACPVFRALRCGASVRAMSSGGVCTLAPWPLVSGRGGQSRVEARIKHGGSLVPSQIDMPTPVDHSSSDRRHTSPETTRPYPRRSCCSPFETFGTLNCSGTCIALVPSYHAKRATHPFTGRRHRHPAHPPTLGRNGPWWQRTCWSLWRISWDLVSSRFRYRMISPMGRIGCVA
jgi:hypothetical protein